MPTPVILLAFANDRADDARYLRDLPEERRGVEGALDAAVRAGVCEVVTRTNVTLPELLGVLDDPRWRDRIAVFHYGGHAGGDRLQLEAADGGAAAAHAAGLASVLAEQHGLALVFLNGCSTRGQVDRLLAAGVPAVVATERAIDDRAATELAAGFYRALAAGRGLDAAFRAASGGVRARIGERARDAYRDLVDDAAAPADDRWPWMLHLAPGAERAAGWSLALAAGDPLFGVPPLPPVDPLPDEPFRRLAWFGAEHAELFFGRGKDVRALYDRVTDDAAPPITLLYGQAGAGKSSLLAAGLLPRLRAAGWAVCYERRDPTLGVAATLRGVLERPPGEPVAGDAWRALEQALDGRPLVVVLDQVEEALTRPLAASALPAPNDAPVPASPAPAAAPAPEDDAAAKRRARFGLAPTAAPAPPPRADELGAFVADLVTLFRDATQRPRGRLVLGFRKEWLAEIEARLVEARLPFSKVFLDRLDRDGVIEAVAGPARAARLRARYLLDVEPGLAEIVADDLLVDREAPVAPTLQVLLSKMWDAAAPGPDGARTLDGALYRRLQDEGILLADFLDQQLASLGAVSPRDVDSGLALDLLAAHTTALGTARSVTADALRAEYPHLALGDLLRGCIDRWLLVDVGAAGTRLAHDTLAPLVRARVEESDRAGQRARRMLEARAKEWRGGHAGSLLDDADLALLDAGRDAMRAWTADEQRLEAASRAAARARQAVRVAAAAAAVDDPMEGALLLAGLRDLPEPPLGVLAASRVAQRALPRTLLAADSPVLDAAFRGWEHVSVHADGVVRTWKEGGRGAPWMRGERDGDHETADPTAVAIGPDGECAVLAGNGAVVLRDPDGDDALVELQVDVWSGDPSRRATGAWFSPDGGAVALLMPDAVVVCDASNGEVLATIATGKQVNEVAFSPDGRELATSAFEPAEDGATVHRWATSGESVLRAAYAGAEDGAAGVTYGPTGRRLLAIAQERVLVWNLDDDAAASVAEPLVAEAGAPVTSAAFAPDESCVVFGCDDGSAWRWPLDAPATQEPLAGHTRAVIAVAFTPSGDAIHSASDDGTARVWDAHSLDERAVLRGHAGPVRKLRCDGRSVLTVSDDGTARVWPLGSASEPAVHAVSALADEDGPTERYEAVGSALAVGAGRFAHVLPEGRGVAIVHVDWPRAIRYAEPDAEGPCCAALALDGAELLLAMHDGSVHRWTTDDPPRRLDVREGPIGAVWRAHLSPDGDRVVHVAAETVLWSLAGRVAPLPLGDPAAAVAFSADGALVAVGREDGTASVWRVAGGDPIALQCHYTPVRHLAFRDDGRDLAVATEHPHASAWRLDWDSGAALELGIYGQYRENAHTLPVTSVAFAPRGEPYLVTTSEDATVRVWSLRDDVAPLVLRGHLGPVTGAAPVPGTRQVVTWSADGTARLWHLDDPSASLCLVQGTELVAGAALSADARRVLTVDALGDVREWSIDWTELVTRIARATEGWRR